VSRNFAANLDRLHRPASQEDEPGSLNFIATQNTPDRNVKTYPRNNINRCKWWSGFLPCSAFPFCASCGLASSGRKRLRKVMRQLANGVVASLIMAASAPVMAGTILSMWVRSDGEELTRKIVEAWNSGHDNKIQLTVIPSPQMVTKFATAAAAGDVPDILSIDLIFMPDFMKAGFMTDITDKMKDDPNIGRVSPSHIKLATYQERLYGVPGTPDVSVLLWNKDLFRKAGGSTRKRAQPRCKRSTRTPKRSGLSVPISMATTLRATAGDAISSLLLR
jgi:maltose-binding protein MalE